MGCGFTCWFKPLFTMALLFAAIGAMGAYWYFFWQNRNMVPCAAVGNDGEVMTDVEVVEPYSKDLLFKRTVLFGGVGALLGLGVGAAFIGPYARRLSRFEREE